MYNHNPAKMAHHNKIFYRTFEVYCSISKNKAISSWQLNDHFVGVNVFMEYHFKTITQTLYITETSCEMLIRIFDSFLYCSISS